jgi:hypothetical protein
MNNAQAQRTIENHRSVGSRTGLRTLKAITMSVLLANISSAPPRLRAESAGTTEYAVKAAFLFHFAQFVEWPAEAFASAQSPLTYCTVGEDPFRGALDQSVNGKSFGSRPLQVQHLKDWQPGAGCQVVFIGEAESKRHAAALASVNEYPVLTVGESEHFVQDGGVIGFCLVENKVRFDVNLEAAGKVRLKISAKLLALARTVIGNSAGG